MPTSFESKGLALERRFELATIAMHKAGRKVRLFACRVVCRPRSSPEVFVLGDTTRSYR